MKIMLNVLMLGELVYRKQKARENKRNAGNIKGNY